MLATVPLRCPCIHVSDATKLQLPISATIRSSFLAKTLRGSFHSKSLSNKSSRTDGHFSGLFESRAEEEDVDFWPVSRKNVDAKTLSSTFQTTTLSSSSSRGELLSELLESSEDEDENRSQTSRRKVAVYWDLDNKPPKVAPYEAAMAVKRAAQKLGQVAEVAAFANRHAFIHVPEHVVVERRQRRELDYLERKGLAVAEQQQQQRYVCGVCGRKCRTNVDLKKHFTQLHTRERNKRLARLSSLRGKKRARFRERIREKEIKYLDAAHSVLTPRTGYGLAYQLRRAGVLVRTVKDRPQSADEALKEHMRRALAAGVDVLCLISDDSDFSETLAEARDSARTVVFGDCSRVALRRYADLWLPWDRVAAGQSCPEIHEAARKWSMEDRLMHEIRAGDDDDYDHAFSSSSSSSSQVDFAAIERLAQRISDDVVLDDEAEEDYVFSDDERDPVLDYRDEPDGEDYFFP